MAGITPYTHESWRKTNADCIRAMTDEELADEITQLMEYIADTVAGITGTNIEFAYKDDCKQFWLGWLKKEVEE